MPQPNNWSVSLSWNTVKDCLHKHACRILHLTDLLPAELRYGYRPRPTRSIKLSRPSARCWAGREPTQTAGAYVAVYGERNPHD